MTSRSTAPGEPSDRDAAPAAAGQSSTDWATREPVRSTHRAPAVVVPVAVFFGILFVATAAIVFFGIPAGLPTVTIAAAPALAAVVTHLAFARTLIPLLPKAVSVRQVIAHLVLGVLAVAVFAGLFALVLSWQSVPLGPPAGGSAELGVLIPVLAITVLAEELGWRGTLQPMLEDRLPRLAATLVTGGVWALWALIFVVVAPLVGFAYGIALLAVSLMAGYFGNGNWVQRWGSAAIVRFLIGLVMLLVGAGALTEPRVVLAYAAAAVPTALGFSALFLMAQSRRRARRAAAAE